MSQPESVTIHVPASSANVGLGFDIWCLGIAHPVLHVTSTRQPSGVEIGGVSSPSPPPPGRTLGQAGIVAATRLLADRGVREGVTLSFEDDGYPVGGLGRSGAEAVGAVLGTAVLYGLKLTRDEAVIAAAAGEPGGHMDNVAGSTNGQFNIIITPPGDRAAMVDVYPTPPDLGIAIGYSSHQKSEGTAGMREAMRRPVEIEDFVVQTGLLSAATAALVSGNTSRFLELAWGDRLHERRRADTGGYGAFTGSELRELKKRLFSEFHIALNISGAGPNIQLLYSKAEHPAGAPAAAGRAIAGWFDDRGIEMSIETTEVAGEGAYDDARRTHSL